MAFHLLTPRSVRAEYLWLKLEFCAVSVPKTTRKQKKSRGTDLALLRSIATSEVIPDARGDWTTA